MEELTTNALIAGFQVSDDNPMLGVESRAALLRSLGQSLLANSDIFGVNGRPGNLVGKIFIFAFGNSNSRGLGDNLPAGPACGSKRS